MPQPTTGSHADRPEGTPLVSVIVRSMARESLSVALDSIADQDHPRTEVVVVDARNAGHGSLPDRAGAHPVRLVQAGRPLPRSQAANVGLDAARGRLVIFLDDDDVFLPGHLSRLVVALQSQTDAVAAYGDVAYGHHGPDGWHTRHLFDAAFDPLRLRFENYLPLHAVMVDRGIERARSCRFDETLDLFEDWDWMLQWARHGTFVHVSGLGARYVASTSGHSGVFDDSTATQAARTQLLDKWLAKDTLEQRRALLLALQEHFRAAHHAADKLVLAARTEDDLRALVADREQNLASALEQVADLRQVLAARDREIADFGQQLADLRQIIAAREREVADGLVHSEGLRRILESREQELAQLAQHRVGPGMPPSAGPAEPTP